MTEYRALDPAAPEANPLRPHLRAPHDLGLAYAFEALNAGALAWSEERQIWRSLQDGVWVEDKARGAHQALRDFVHHLENHASGLANDHPDRAAWAAAVTRHHKNETHGKLLHAVKTGLNRPESAYDVDPMQLNTRGEHLLDLVSCTPRLRSGEYFTKVTRVAYRHGATDPRWDAFLAKVQPDPATRAYVQRCFGAGLSGLPGQRLIFAIYGPAGSGKSTISSVVARAMGSYTTTLHHAALALRQYGNQGHTSELIPLVGARMAFIHEVPEGMQLNAALLKTIVGGEEFSVSEKGKPYFATRFCARLYLTSNHPITLSSTDDAAWARIHLLPFEHPIADPDRDAIHKLSEDQGVLEACLAWLVEGWVDFRAKGIAAPSGAAQMALRQREGNSLIGEWLEECVERVPGAKMESNAARRACAEWLACNGYRAGISIRRFAEEMRAAGFESVRHRAGVMWLGCSPRGGSDGSAAL